LPYIEQDNMYRLFVNLNGNDLTGIRYGNQPNIANVTSQQLKVLTCPSDTVAATYAGMTHHNYGVNYGNTNMYGTTVNGIVFGGAPFRGYPAGWLSDAKMQQTYGWAQPDSDKRVLFQQYGFAGQPQQAIGQITDGTSNTLMVSEVIQGQGGDSAPDLRGFVWWGSASGFTAFNLPNSNAPDVMTGGACNIPATWNIPCTTINSQSFPKMSSARSQHNGRSGVNAAFCDGHVTWISNGISLATWQALSTSQGGEVLDNSSY
jgi:prepilin-type processing-associated H-X9-DG protein